jgi:hypothetical protein
VSDGEGKSEERDNAQLLSRNCQLCGGGGMPIVFHREWSGSRIGHREGYNSLEELVQVPFPAEVAAHCVCPLGRWIRSKTSAYLNRRIPDGADIVNGRSPYGFDEPTIEPDTHPIPTRRDIDAMFRRPA